MGQRSGLAGVATRVATRSRAQKWDLYRRIFPPDPAARILDVGASRFVQNPLANYFLSHYPYPDRVTAVGISDLAELRTKYPGITFVQADGRKLPFEDDEFEIVHSNAVIEHVGPREDQRQFIHEITRVSKAGFVTTPSRSFPIETHTFVPVVHWLPWSAQERVINALPFTRKQWNVWLLSRREFAQLFPATVDVRITSTKLAAWTMTLIGIFTKNMAARRSQADEGASIGGQQAEPVG